MEASLLAMKNMWNLKQIHQNPPQLHVLKLLEDIARHIKE